MVLDLLKMALAAAKAALVGPLWVAQSSSQHGTQLTRMVWQGNKIFVAYCF
jgi:hypothetical protein